MTRAELQHIVESEWYRQGDHSVETVFKVIASCLSTGEKVTIKHFGTFLIKTRKTKIAQNIHKGENIVVPEHKIAAWKPSPKIIIK
ncbi:HU family DNA-binding protein [Emticicia sp.]|uniref:HU family DNA-binding protein n=1 Tax=Emticicia sp. TaxID=1930953 RepID=UPI0037535185